MERLRGGADFEAVFASGQRTQNAFAALVVRSREGSGVRIGFSSSKRVGGAVQRNRARRRLREACRAELAGGSGTAGWDIVCIPRKQAIEADFAALRSAVAELLRRAGVITE